MSGAMLHSDDIFQRKNRPLALSHPLPRLLGNGRKALDLALQRGCWCGSATATLKRRLIANSTVRVELQCDYCGRSVGGPLKRAEHPFFLDYPVWDDGKAEAFWAKYREEADSRFAALQKQRAEELARRRADYHAWLRQSPEWRRIRAAVLRRAGYTCEACLAVPAEHVHHDTYAFGRLPPAWCLRAVCGDCHDRLHTDGDDWCRISGGAA